MKSNLSGAEKYLTGVNPAPVTMFYGPNVDQNRRAAGDYARALLGANASDELRLTKLDWKAISGDPAQLYDSVKEIGFFPGIRGVIVNDAGDATTKVIETLLADWLDGDAHIILNAGNLTKTSKLRKLLEPSARAMVVGLYDDPLNASAVRQIVDGAQLRLEDTAKPVLMAFAQTADRDEFRNFVEILSLYQGDGAALTAEQVSALIPGQTAAAADKIVQMMLDGRSREMVANLRLAPAQGISMHHINATARRNVLQFLQVKTSPNPSQAINALRPPFFGERRRWLEQTLRLWNDRRLLSALETLNDAEAEIRKGRKSLPDQAYIERIFLRVALQARG